MSQQSRYLGRSTENRQTEDFDKPSHPEFGGEFEGRCPLCGKVMAWERKHLSDGKRWYRYDFTIYKCDKRPHHHGYFRLLGGEGGYVRIRFPQIFRYGKDVRPDEEKNKDIADMIELHCPECNFVWKELEAPPREETYCPNCGNRISFPSKSSSNSHGPDTPPSNPIGTQKSITDF